MWAEDTLNFLDMLQTARLSQQGDLVLEVRVPISPVSLPRMVSLLQRLQEKNPPNDPLAVEAFADGCATLLASYERSLEKKHKKSLAAAGVSQGMVDRVGLTEFEKKSVISFLFWNLAKQYRADRLEELQELGEYLDASVEEEGDEDEDE
jgi:hypothetical protein